VDSVLKSGTSGRSWKPQGAQPGAAKYHCDRRINGRLFSSSPPLPAEIGIELESSVHRLI